MKLMDHVAVLFLIFWGTLILFSFVAIPIYNHTNIAWGFPPLHILASMLFVVFFVNKHSDRCVVVSHCCFNLHFPDVIWCGASFHVLICHLCIFFGEVPVQVFCPFFKVGFLFSYCWILRVLSLFILDKRWVFCKNFLTVYGLFSDSLDIILQSTCF